MSAPKLSGLSAEMVSVAEFARRADCDEAQVRRAIKHGRLSRNSIGLMDAAQLASAWRKPNKRTTGARPPAAQRKGKLSGSDNPDNRKLSGSRQQADVVRTLAAMPPAGTLPTIDEAALSSFADQLLDGRYASINDALRIKENALALKHLLAARREAKSLIEVDRAEAILYEAARQARDAWINWPARFAPLVAADLDVEFAPLLASLERHIHEQLERLGDPSAHELAEAAG